VESIFSNELVQGKVDFEVDVDEVWEERDESLGNGQCLVFIGGAVWRGYL